EVQLSVSKRGLFRRLFDETTTETTTCEWEDCLDDTLGDRLQAMGISRRGFMQFCAGMASLMALPPSMGPAMAATLLAMPAKPSVLYMSFQECTGCLESLVNSFPSTRANSTSIENLILNLISLDYQETLMAAAGEQAESWRNQLIQHPGYVLIVDGSIPVIRQNGVFLPSPYFVSGGQSGVERLRSAAENAGLVIAVGTCASFGGLPKADPNPTGAVSIGDLLVNLGLGSKPLINVSGCPPIAEVITGVILYYLTQGKAPELDNHHRPKMFYGETIHDECYRKEFFERELFAERFDDANARKGYCLLHLGCKGPVSHNACSTVKWNQGTSFPMQSGHGCLGCAEPDFWDLNLGSGKGFYVPLPPGSFEGD
ncbi:MAG: hydrogenase small subunit, partial [Methylococcaceae bacterium]|nr:hydrogenase small subunit [Methylococcaceae bacterium]